MAAKRAAVRLPHRRPAPVKTVLSRGQRQRQAKRENESWKQKALEAKQRAKQVKQHGAALGTMDTLLSAIEASEELPILDLPCSRSPVGVVAKKGKKKLSVRAKEKATEQRRFEAIVNFGAFQASPMETMRRHLELKAQK